MREIRALSSPSDVMDMLAIWSSSPPIVLAPGAPMAGVDLVDGLILERPLRSASMPTRLCPVQTIVLSSRFEYSDAPLHVSTTIQVVLAVNCGCLSVSDRTSPLLYAAGAPTNQRL